MGIPAPDWVPVAQERLRYLANLSTDWDGYGSEAPSSHVLALAERVIAVLSDMDFEPSGIVPTADTGIGVVFYRPESCNDTWEKYADIELFPDGEVLAGMNDRTSDPVVWDVGDNIRDAAERIRGFLDGNTGNVL